MSYHERLATLLDRKLSIYVAATGAGAGLQQKLWSIPGCSSFLAGATFPYANEETDAFLGFKPERYASNETAMDLAMAAYMRAVRPDPSIESVGLGLTASVASTRERRGDHRIHIAVMTKDRVLLRETKLTKGVGEIQRFNDGNEADFSGLNALLVATGIVENDGLDFDVTEQSRQRFFLHSFFELTGKRKPAEALRWDKRQFALFPGSFNPPHEGHFGIAASHIGRTVFSLTVDSPHKPPLTLSDMLRRAKLLDGHDRLLSEGDALYVQKARRHPGVPILIGADACLCMLDPSWGEPIEPMLREFADLGTVFRVAGRLVNSEHSAVDTILKQVPPAYHHMFCALPGRWDISSSVLRSSQKGDRSSP